MFTIQDLGVTYGARTLFSQATIAFSAGARYGIVGANGSGKSTLLRIVSGEEEPTEGRLILAKDLRIGVLSQDHFALDKVPILHVVMMGVPVLWAAMQEKEEMLGRAAQDPEAFDVERYGELEDVVIAHDGYTLESRAADILEGLNIPTVVHMQPLSTLSGGYKLRVLLAQTLASDPDILLLDEPTNHLDIVSIGWLERFLADDYKGCALVVSHDHRFLDTISTHTVDVDYGRITLYTGNYSEFDRAKTEDYERREAEIEKNRAQIAEQKAFVERFRAKASKARQAQSRLKQIDKMEIQELPESSRQHPYFKLEAARDTGRQVLEIEDLSKIYDPEDGPVLQNINLRIMRGERVALIGPNGAGKSTLLKILMNETPATQGSFEWGHAVVPGYFSQDHAETEGSEEATIHDWLWSFCQDRPMGFVRGKLAEVLFGKDHVDKKLGALSGGEIARLVLAKISIEQPTVLVLDEPTNHLDLEGIDALARGLEAYPNTIIFVSHDRWFVSRLATRIVELQPDGLEDYPGSYEDYLHWSGGERDHLDHEHALSDALRQQKS